METFYIKMEFLKWKKSAGQTTPIYQILFFYFLKYQTSGVLYVFLFILVTQHKYLILAIFQQIVLIWS